MTDKTDIYLYLMLPLQLGVDRVLPVVYIHIPLYPYQTPEYHRHGRVPLEVSKVYIHLSLKYLRGTRDPKWQLIETKPSIRCNKGGQQPGIFSK